ncbi:MAG: uncharacterized protein K0S75_1225 [Clostridia bacterium]|nr:uncharacterized protein [Clostridia bacterium]
MNFERPKIVISKCIGFENCRFDGSMIHNHEVEQLKPFVDFMLICPEMEMGLTSPRESLRIIETDGVRRLVLTKSGVDMTEDMKQVTKEAYLTIRAFQPEGFLLKSRSPSCGIKEVRVYESIGKVPCISKKEKGIFSGFMMEHFPDAVFEDEGRISNFNIRENFYTMIFTKADFRMVKTENTIKALTQFHEKNKYLFMAHSQNQLKVLGRIVANHKNLTMDEIYEAYEENLHKLLLKMPTCGQYVNVMLHIFGYFSKMLSEKEKAYFIDSLEDYHNKHIPQSTVMAILWAWVIRFNEEYLIQQTVFEPFPKALIQVTDSGKGL